MRMRKEYDCIVSDNFDKSVKERAAAIINYLDENMGAISAETAEYIASLGHPLMVMSIVPVEVDDGALSEESAKTLIAAIDKAAVYNSNPNKKIIEKELIWKRKSEQ